MKISFHYFIPEWDKWKEFLDYIYIYLKTTWWRTKVGSQSERSETNNKQSYYKIPF